MGEDEKQTRRVFGFCPAGAVVREAAAVGDLLLDGGERGTMQWLPILGQLALAG